MPLEVNKQGKEIASNLIRRFTLRLRRSGILLEARHRQFFQKPKSVKLKKRSALRREEKKQEYLQLKKLGRI
jgi:ribosomal protein S21